ncbi:hypothetical protein EDD16DRAFT_1519689 [Pisolithus croceorrhizus]|nr:hypothetical protein EDD16DRAFT_1519689 [Pisolithus croceorrhizus]KAI6137482.1 hypothetical protein EDD17DRAFT_1517281 [Pisolithus thermaeus]
MWDIISVLVESSCLGYKEDEWSSTAEGIKQVAFEILMNLYILFCPTQPVTEDGQWLPMEILDLQLNDDVQYHCTGFIQAEIKQYGELLEDDRPSEELTERDGSSDSRKMVSLKQEYQFIVTVLPFLRAVCVGAVHVSHGTVPLAHYVIMDILQEECMYNDNGEVIIDTVTQALKEYGRLVVIPTCVSGFSYSFCCLFMNHLPVDAPPLDEAFQTKS